MNLKNGKVFTSKSVGTGPSSYEKSIYRAAVSQRLKNTGLLRAPAALPTGQNVDTQWKWSRKDLRGNLDDSGEEKNNFLYPGFEALML